ncbi:AsmA-like C-terminal region-containing protein [Mongoliibacter ruber]|uniref:AsmA-like protein n=1 Tax=Mongoliibacter ruber TaxID=1750599 RepID=A0A2T0WUI0_9BACT|nr:AsmA-like C-terminal region-containing protein [Mongoliibacter ruber]PRY90345.1 AsmA-like protein [Mongoliibacter ruber]
MVPWIKKGLLALLFLPFFVIVLATILFTFHQEVIVQKALKSANEQLVGKLTINESKVSVFKEFPYISIDLRGVSFYEDKRKETKPFYEAGHLYLGFNIWEILEGKYKVKSIRISDGYVDVIQDANGGINVFAALGIQRNTSEEESKIIEFDLAKVKISNFQVSFENSLDTISYLARIDSWKSNVNKNDNNFKFNLKGNLIFDVLKAGQPTFFAEKSVNLGLNLNFDSKNQVLNINHSIIGLESANFASYGKIDFLESGVKMDLKVEGQKPDFNMFGAFLPTGVGAVLNEYQNEGEVFFKGSVKGILGYGSKPLITIEFGCENAFFQRLDNNLKVDDLRFFGFFTNGSERNLKTSELRVQNFNARPEQGVFQGELTVRNFEDPYIKVKLHADLDLGFVGEFFRLEKFEGISGQVLVTMDFDELVDLDATGADLAQLKQSIQTELILKNLEFSISDYPLPIKKVNAYAVMQDGSLSMNELSFQIEGSDFEFKGNVSDLPALFHRFDKTVNLSIEANSNKIDLAQILNRPEKKEIIHDFSTQISFAINAAEFFDFKYLPHGKLVVDNFHATLENYPHTFEDFKAELLIDENKVDIQKFSGKIDQSDFLLKATFLNYPKWFQEDLAGASTIDWSLKSSKLRLKDILFHRGVSYLPTSWGSEEFSALDLQGKINLYFLNGLHSVELLLDKLNGRTQLHPLKLEDFKGIINWNKNYFDVRGFGGKMGQSVFNFDLSLNLSDSSQSKNNYFHLSAEALDLDALMGFKGFEGEVKHAEAFNIFNIPFRDMEFSVDIKKLNYHYNWLENIKGKARTTTNHMVHVDTLGLKVARGSLGIKGYLNGSDPEKIYLHTQISAEKLDIDKLLFKLENSGKDIMINENLKGNISGTVKGKFLVYPDLTPIIDKSKAKLALTVYNGVLINFAPFTALSNYFSDRNLNMIRFDTLTNTFDLKDGELLIPNMNINSSLGFLEVSGRQSLDLDMEYQIRIPLNLVTQVGFRALFGGRSRNEVDPEQEDAIIVRNTNRRVRFLNINVQGNPDDYRVSLGRVR